MKQKLKFWYYYNVIRKRENFWPWLAYRLPRKLAYWCAIRVGAHATTGKWSNQVVPELIFTDALQRWDE